MEKSIYMNDLLIFIAVIITLIAISIFITVSVDKRARKNAKLSSDEILIKIVKCLNIRLGGLTLIKISFIIIIVFFIVEIISVLGFNVFGFIPENINTFIYKMLLPGVIYYLTSSLIGLIIFCVGHVKVGTISRALNLYTDRELTEFEKEFVHGQINLEKIAKQIQAQQLIGNLAGNSIIGNSFKARSTSDSINLINTMSKSKSKWLKCLKFFIVLGFFLTLVIYYNIC